MKCIFLLASILTLTGCQSAALFLANAGHRSNEHYTLASDIAYGKQPWQKLDVYQPTQHSIAPAPVVVFLYGGGWTSGDKDDYAFIADQLTSQGYMVVIGDYVKYPQAHYPAFQHDAALLTDWVYTHSREYGGDAGNMHLMGHSAGAHIGVMLLADKQFLQQHNLSPNVYRSFVGLAGPYHFTPTAKKYRNIFQIDKYGATRMQASHFIDGTEPPMLLLHGKKDNIVGFINIERLQSAIGQAGGKVMIKQYDDISHLTILGDFSSLFSTDQPVMEDIIAYLNHHAGKKTPPK